MKKHSLLSIGFLVFALATNSATLVRALERAPLNPEFLQYQQQLQAKALTTRTADGHGLGYMPAPFKLPQPGASLSAQRNKLQALPASYDLRTYGKVSPVRNQGNYGNCWAFATFGSMESCLLTGETWDFSENNLANLHGLNSAYGDGGTYYMSLAYLTRWSGPVLESADPYSNGPKSPQGLPVQKHIQSAQFIPDRTSATDNDAIKQAIMNYGGMASSFYYAGPYYKSANCAYYYSGFLDANHAITIIGWDDVFSRTNFNTTPPGDGAFLIKNSWGTSWGSAGYFWISYYDKRIGKDNCLFLNAESTANYASVYQYDPLGFCTAFGYNNTNGWGANIFTNVSGTIEAVGFYALAAGASYEVRVYTGVTAGSPTSGTLSATKTGTLTYGGYYTVTLDSPVTCSTRFSVVVKLTTPGSSYPIPAECRIASYSSAATASAGESYLSSDGSAWDEATDGSSYFNVCIKAFGTGGKEPGPTQGKMGVLNDYDGDGTSDLAVYRDGYWSILSLANGIILTPAGSWGGPDAIPVPGNYDGGDSQSDLTVYCNGYWAIYSLANGIISINAGIWGGAGWTPVPGDYDSDGKADLAVYRDGFWSIFSLTHGIILNNAGVWGGPGWIPVPGDYDGDGTSDLALYRDGYWCIYSLANGIILANEGPWGGAGWTLVPGDYDGDGKADLAVYRDGYWSILSLANGLILYNAGIWGGPDAIPVPGDYDGCGKSDLALYRDGYWSILSLANGIILNNDGPWGGPGWTPVQ